MLKVCQKSFGRHWCARKGIFGRAVQVQFA